MIRRSDIREQSDGYRYDSFDVAPPGTFGHPSIVVEGEPTEGWLDRAREALSFGSNRRFEMLAWRVDQLFRWQ